MRSELLQKLLDKSHRLVSSTRIEGTAVFGSIRGRLGTIHSVMIDKQTGKVAYAVLSLDGGLPDGSTRAHPVPWGMLNYDKALGGYLVKLTPELINRVPGLTVDDDSDRLLEILDSECPDWVEAASEGALSYPLEPNDANAQPI